MNEEDWRTGVNPQPMLRYLLGTQEQRVQAVEAFPNARGSDRKLRLFACACYHRLHHLLSEPIADSAVLLAERFADADADLAQLVEIEEAVHDRLSALEPIWRASREEQRAALRPRHSALSLAGVVCWRPPHKAAWYAASNAYMDRPLLEDPNIGAYGSKRWELEAREKRAQCDLLRDIFGNPFQDIPFAASWRSNTAVSRAHQLYTSRDFSTMPLLADALEEAGCTHQGILAHCRDNTASHVRGCWVVDLVLEKELDEPAIPT